jgi:DNA-binding transcriptional MerR regulator
MRIGELARRGGVPVGTVKYYLREGLLPTGTLTAATQATYEERHVQRLALVRALVGTAGLSIAATAAVLRAIDDPPASHHELLGEVAEALSPATDPDQADLTRARALVDRWGWRIQPDSPCLGQLATALEAVGEVGHPDVDGLLDRYAGLMAQLAAGDLADVPAGPPAETVRFVVSAIVLLEPLLLALRRLAQEDASARLFGGGAVGQARGDGGSPE